MLDSMQQPPGSPQVHVVFLHGAGLGPWIWETARETLPFPSVALDVPSRQVGTSPARCAIDLLSHPDFPIGSPIVLVLHSLAGVLESALVSALGDRLQQVVHVASVVPPPGGTFASTMGFPNSLVLRLLFLLRPRGLSPSPAMILGELGGGLSPSLRTALVARHRPEFPGLFLQPVAHHPVHTRRTYLRCLRDRSVSPALQTRIAHRLEARIRDLDCGHLPMLSDAETFVRILSQEIGFDRSSPRGSRAPAATILR